MSRSAASNFEVYRASRVARTYLVISTSAVRHGGDPPKLTEHYDVTPALDRLAEELARAHAAHGGRRVPVTLKVHGFNVGREGFEREVLADADPAQYAPPAARSGPGGPTDLAAETFRPADRFLIGYRWPSEGMLSRGSLFDTAAALFHAPAIGLVLLLLPVLALLWAGCLEATLERSLPWLAAITGPLVHAGRALAQGLETRSPAAATALRVLFASYLGPCIAATLLGVGLVLLLLRLSTYLRDRERALRFGVPDLGEFMRALEERLVPRQVQIELDVIGHSMGALLLINAFRVMSDYFHGAGPDGPCDVTLGRAGTYHLGTLILCAADIPAAMATPDQNNYFLSALRRFRAVHVFSSDRDVILKWLSSLANWASEPRYDLSGRKLGNVFLVKREAETLGRPDSRAGWTLWPVTRPVFSNHGVYTGDPIVSPRYPAELHFHDCTLEASVSGTEGAGVFATLAILVALAAMSLWFWQGLWKWLLAQIILFLGLGLLLRPLWPWLRDRGLPGGIAGLFAEWPVLTMFATFWVGWNPHSGYFMFGHAPRRRIAALLREPGQYPPRDAQGREIEELDEFIRYKFLRISV
jgi:hypothetical protein